MEAQAQREQGRGECDTHITQMKTVGVTRGWDPSSSMPADLLPRAAYKSSAVEWNHAVWLAQRLCGPAGLVLRPRLWCFSVLMAVFQKGDMSTVEAYGMIFVRVHMGLLQESLLTRRLLPRIRAYQLQGQSGYVRGGEDPQVLLHEICAILHHQNRRA